MYARFGTSLKAMRNSSMHGRCIDRKSLAADPANSAALATARWGRKQIIWEAARQPLAAPVGHERPSTPHISPLPLRVTPVKMWDDFEEETPAPEAVAEEAPPAAEEAEAKPEEAEPPAPEQVVMGTEPKKLVFRHWIRPKFLQYSYLYDYQKNYYDQVINYLDRRNKGLPVEKPRAQTWAERVLRTYLSKNTSSLSSRSTSRDTALLRGISSGARFHRYHSKSLISRKYSKLGFNTVSI